MDLSYLRDVVHVLSQGLLYPVLIVLIALVAYCLYTIGSLLVEIIIERRHFKVSMPEFLRSINDSSVAEMSGCIQNSKLLLRQKVVLMTLFKNRDLPTESRWALAKKLLNEQADHFRSKVSRNETVSKAAPIFGLMGTLIPLGPGILALGQGDTAPLSASMLLAFDTTVLGLIVSAICFVIAKIRKRWYAQYAAALEAAVTTLLEKIDLLEGEGIDGAEKVAYQDHALETTGTSTKKEKSSAADSLDSGSGLPVPEEA